jgi:hypothetical protein
MNRPSTEKRLCVASRQIGFSRRVRSARDGMITWAVLFAVLILLILFSLVSNTAIVVNQKLETQNAADAVAYSSGTWVALGMNSVTATNHVVGELNALYTIHHALGGRWMEEHHSDKKRNDGDWHPTFPPILPGVGGFGGMGFQFTNYVGLDFGYHVAKFLSILTIVGEQPEKGHYDNVRENPIADIKSAIFEGKEMLKVQMMLAYALHIKGAIEVLTGYANIAKGIKLMAAVLTFPAGAALFAKGVEQVISGLRTMRNAKNLERIINGEYVALDLIEQGAIAITPIKKRIPTAITGIHAYQKLSVNVEIPLKAMNAAKEVAKRQGMEGFALGDFPDGVPSSVGDAVKGVASFFPHMPVEREKVTDEEKSQMVRATYPWVRHWRTKLLLLLTATTPSTLGGTGDGFIKWTNRYSLQSSAWLRTDEEYDNELTVKNYRNSSTGTGQTGKDVLLYSIKDLSEEGEKGEEKWNKASLVGSKRADEIFCSMGFVKSKKPSVVSPAFFRQENPHGVVCYSQVIIYNANPQPESVDAGKKQPKVGWDTLAWEHDKQRVKEWKSPEGWFGFGGPIARIPEWIPEPSPEIKLNWQTKLTPVTTFKLGKTTPAAAIYDSDVRPVLIKGSLSDLSPFLLQNH